MASTIRVDSVEVGVPPGVRVDVRDGLVTLHFEEYTGSVSLRPPPLGKRSVGEEEEGESSVDGAKRARLETPADDSEPSSGAPAAVSALRTMQHDAFYRNGGGMTFSQDSDAEEGEAPAPRAISWEEAVEGSTNAESAPHNTLDEEDAVAPGGSGEGWRPPEENNPRPPSMTAAAAREMLASSRPSPGASSTHSRGSPRRGPKSPGSGPGALSPAVGNSAGSRRAGSSGKQPAKGRASKAFADSPEASASGSADKLKLSEKLVSSDWEAFPFNRSQTLTEWEWCAVTPAGDAPPPRWGHSAASLGGRMYIMGGDDLTDSDDDILRDLYMLDASSNTWRQCRDAPHGRCWHSLTVVGGSLSGNSDILLAFGGETLKAGTAPGTATRVPLNSMLSYDPEFEVWYDAVDRGTRPSARLGHTASLHTANGGSEKLVVFAGWSGRKYSDPELRELHIGSDWAWRRVLSGGQPPLARAYHSATKLFGHRLLVFGGHDAELRTFCQPHVLDLSTMSWHHPEVSGTPPAPRTGHAAVCLDGYRILIHGGWEPITEQDGTERFRMHEDMAILDTDDWTWSRPTLRGEPPKARVGHSIVALPAAGEEGASLVLFGGRADGDKALNDTYALRPLPNKPV